MFFPGSVIPSYDVDISSSGNVTYTPQEDHRMAEQRERWEQRDPAQSPPTTKQRVLLDKLLLSEEFSAEEVAAAKDWQDSAEATEEKMSALIDRALHRTKVRKSRRKDAQQRKAQYHANKEVADG